MYVGKGVHVCVMSVWGEGSVKLLLPLNKCRASHQHINRGMVFTAEGLNRTAMINALKIIIIN